MAIVSKHDRIFRSSLLDIRVAREFFQQHLPPEVLSKVNLASLEPCPQSYITQDLKLSQSDVLYKTEVEGEIGYLYLLCEHQLKPDPLMPFRVLQYNVGIWNDHLKKTEAKTLPLIINTVFYNGKHAYCHSTDIRDLIDAPKTLVDLVWNQPFNLIEVNNILDKELLKYRWAGILEFFMKHHLERDLLPRLRKAIDILHNLELEGGKDYVIRLLNYSIEAVKVEDLEKFVSIIKEKLSSESGEKIMTIAEHLRKEGREEGKREGREEGRREGMQAALKLIQQGKSLEEIAKLIEEPVC